MTRKRTLCSLFLALIAVTFFFLVQPPMIVAADAPMTAVSASDEKVIDDTKESLDSSTVFFKKFPWYSAKTDDSVFLPFPDKRPPRNSFDLRGFFAALSVAGYTILIIVVVAIIVFIALLIWYILCRTNMMQRFWKKEEYQERQRRIETLPEEARDMFDDLVGAARRAFEAGDYHKAIIYYFSHQLVWLDTHELIKMHKGKTNHEYARELNHAMLVKPLYVQTMSLFESVYYGEHSITRQLFLSVWEQRNHFNDAVKEEKPCADANKQKFGNGLPSHQKSFSMVVELPEQNNSATPNTVANNSLASKTTRHLLLWAIICLSITSTGCWQREVDNYYVPPNTFDTSINGASVFCDLCVQKKHTLREGYAINAYARRSDVVVWFSRVGGAASSPVDSVTSVENWLIAKPGRTFVYVGHAFESDRDYWSSVLDKTTTEKDQRKVKNKLLEAEALLFRFLKSPKTTKRQSDNQKNTIITDNNLDDTAGEDENPFENDDDNTVGDNNKYDDVLNNNKADISPWFENKPCEKEVVIKNIEGSDTWLQGIDKNKLQLSLFENWVPGDGVEPLLRTDGQVIVARKQVGESQLILVCNGGFILNYPLVNHEHRKLADRLINQFGDTKKRIFVYKSNATIDFSKSKADYNDKPPHVLLTLLQTWPFSIILPQVLVIGFVFCFYKWPILGRPQTVHETQVTDFGKHIDAYAELLASAHDDHYADKQLDEYRKIFGE